MVTSSGASTGADCVRSLNLPRPVEVALDAESGLPRALRERGRWREIERVQETWQVDDEWWREPISRHYLQVVLAAGSPLTLFHDRIADRWFAQSY
ncbi:MAG: hypothetical protein IT338_20825 [Thermomicrobiales bacterium]|nr:hypothetical protein [Thermomicrobiales bacterium]